MIAPSKCSRIRVTSWAEVSRGTGWVDWYSANETLEVESMKLGHAVAVPTSADRS
jgi:hypothetical protein